MSSHHIIREDQEPALLIMDAHATPFEQIQELLEWSPTVVVSESALHEVMTWGIKIDVVVASEEKTRELNELLHDQFPLKLLSCNTSSDGLATALYFLIAKEQKAVNIISKDSLDNFGQFSSIDISVFQSGKRWSLIKSGAYEKWFPAGRAVRIYPNDQADLKTTSDGIVTIQREKEFWVSEE